MDKPAGITVQRCSFYRLLLMGKCLAVMTWQDYEICI